MTTVAEAVDLPYDLFRRYAAVRETGHALTALATGQAWVIECALEKGVTPDGTPYDAFTKVRWETQLAYAALLQAGAMAQDRWLREQGLWTVRRELATQVAARHSMAAVQTAGVGAADVERAAAWAEELLQRHWRLLLDCAELLDRRGYVYGSHLSGLLRDSGETGASAADDKAQAPGT
ncbi:hypothetical protein PUR49_11165 [Streptomyces sp. BE147]|uniref:hypothetical protein n=1 Tax=Streptomyces sp. BE147 TaxID=3002524 RepID=UPI002E78C6AF|nr:hypothetical protein [Streptomyces sp. BE147]MEE1737055.1 hypothetical protein [Streptomyces sp. BE147]